MTYVRSVRVSGERLKSPIIRHEQIARGTKLVYEMSGRAGWWDADDGAPLAGGMPDEEEAILEGWRIEL
jgi:putative alpha-1,2-mannosidase